MNEKSYREAEQRLWEAEGARPSERRVRLPRLGVEIRVQEVGEGDPVLYLHGGPNSGSTWAPLAARLPGFRSLIVDRPGTGLSDPLDLGIADAQEFGDIFVADVLDGLEVERAHVVGSSFGGWVALRSAAVSPERFARMVQMACPAGAPGMGMPPFMRAIVFPGLGRLISALPSSERSAKMTMRQIGHGKSLAAGRIPPAFFDWYLALTRHTDTMRSETRLIGQAASLRGWHAALDLPAELLARVSVPTRFLWGADDTFGGEDVARQMVDAMPDAELEMLADAGHLPWLDDPAYAADAIADWFGVRRSLATEPAGS